jgi:hypothetical protein
MKIQVNKMFDIDKLNIYWAGDTQDKIFGRRSSEELLNQYNDYVLTTQEAGEEPKSFEEFNSSQDRELLEYEKQIILHPRNAHHLLMPLTDEIFVKDIYKELTDKGVIEKVNSSFVGSMLPNTNVRNAIIFVKGKYGVGPVALGITNSATNQADGLNINTFYQNQDGEDVSTALLFKDMEGTYTLDNYTDNEGTIISEILSQLLTTQVDNVKNPTAVLMNINMQTLGVMLYLIRRKINPKSIVLLLQQPIISEYLKYQRRNESLFNKQADSKSNNTKDKKHELSKDYLIKKLLSDLKYSTDVLPDVYRVGDENPRLSIDNAGMFENIKTKKFDQTQLDYLAYFMELQSQSRAFSDFQQSQNSDTKGLKDKQMLDESNAIRARMELSQIVDSNDVSRLDQQGVISPFYQYGRLRYNIFNQFYTLSNSIFGGMLTTFKDRAAELEKSDGKDRVRQTIENDFLLFLIHNYGTSKAEFDRLTKDGSVAKRVLALKDTIPSNLVLKAFFPVLRNTTDLTDNRKIDNLRLFEKELNALDSNDMRSSLEEIHDVDSDLYNDIVKLLMFQSGLNISPFNYRSVVPVGLNTNRTEFNDYEYLYQDIIQNAVKAMKAERMSLKQAEVMFGEFKTLFAANNVKFLRKYSSTNYPYPLKKTWERKSKDWVLESTGNDRQTQTQLGNAYHKQYFRELINGKTTTAKGQNKVENKEVFRDDDTRIETSNTETLITQPKVGKTKSSTIKNLSMTPDNIAQIKAGTVTTTIRTWKMNDGLYELPDGTIVNITFEGPISKVGDNIFNFKTNENISLDSFAKGEGFKDWKDFDNKNRFSTKFITGIEGRYLYSVKLAQTSSKQSEDDYLFIPEASIDPVAVENLDDFQVIWTSEDLPGSTDEFFPIDFSSNQSASVRNTIDTKKTESFEKEIGIRNSDGTRKKMKESDYETALRKVKRLNSKYPSMFLLIKTTGEKGDSRVYYSIALTDYGSKLVSMDYKPDLSIRDKYFENGSKTDAKTILEKISKSDSNLATVAKQLLKYVGVNNVDVNLVNNIDEPVFDNEDVSITAGRYYSRASKERQNSISIAEFVNFTGGRSEAVIIHEILHALTFEELFYKNKDAAKDFEKLFEYVKANSPKGMYALTNLDEFMTGIFTDARFIQHLKTLPATNSVKEYKNLFEEILDLFRKLFKLQDSSALTQAMSIASHVLMDVRSEKDYKDSFEGMKESANSRTAMIKLGTVEDVLKTIDNPIAKKILSYTNINVKNLAVVSSELNNGMNGTYYHGINNNHPYIVIDRRLDRATRDRVLLHEAIHAYTVGILSTIDKKSLTSKELEFRDNIEGAYRIARTNIKGYHYGLTDINEFMAEGLTQPRFRDLLSQINVTYNDLVTKEVSNRENLTVLDLIMNAVYKLFGGVYKPETKNILVEGKVRSNMTNALEVLFFKHLDEKRNVYHKVPNNAYASTGSQSNYSPSLKMYEGFINLNQLYTGEEIIPFIGESEYYRYLVPMLLKMNPSMTTEFTKNVQKSLFIESVNQELPMREINKVVKADFSRSNGVAAGILNAAIVNMDADITTTVHEMIHLTLQKEYEKNGEFREKIDALYEYAWDRQVSDGTYGFTNPKEFLAEAMSDPEFMEELNNIQYENETVWSYLMTLVSDFINGLLNIELKSDSVLAEVVRVSEQILNKNITEISKNTKVTLSSVGSEIVENWNTYFPDYSWMNDAQKQMTAKLVEEGKITLNCKF